MIDNPFEHLIASAPPADTSSWRWATVTQVGPLRIRMDGDSVPLLITPTDLSNPVRAVGDRVWVQLEGRRVVIVGPQADVFDSGWVDVEGGSYPWAGHGHRPQLRRIGDRVEARGHFRRQTASDNYHSNDGGYWLVTIPDYMRPSADWRGVGTRGGPGSRPEIGVNLAIARSDWNDGSNETFRVLRCTLPTGGTASQWVGVDGNYWFTDRPAPARGNPSAGTTGPPAIDTGWIQVNYRDGFSTMGEDVFEMRHQGDKVYVRGTVTGGPVPSGNYVAFADVPDRIPKPRHHAGWGAYVSNGRPGGIEINPDGRIIFTSNTMGTNTTPAPWWRINAGFYFVD